MRWSSSLSAAASASATFRSDCARLVHRTSVSPAAGTHTQGDQQRGLQPGTGGSRGALMLAAVPDLQRTMQLTQPGGRRQPQQAASATTCGLQIAGPRQCTLAAGALLMLNASCCNCKPTVKLQHSSCRARTHLGAHRQSAEGGRRGSAGCASASGRCRSGMPAAGCPLRCQKKLERQRAQLKAAYTLENSAA
jgi:hypothetical protein